MGPLVIILADVCVASVVLLFNNDGDTLQISANNDVDNLPTIGNNQELVAPNIAEHDTESPITATSNSGRPKRGQKRKYFKTDDERKSKRNRNQQYVNKDGNTVEPRKFKHNFICPCSVTEKIPRNAQNVSQQKIVEIFFISWNLGSYDAQNAAIAGAAG